MSALWREDVTLEESVALYQDLIDSGQAWLLEGHVGRTAMAMIEDGLCTLGPEGHTDYWGNRIPSRYEVMPGTKGSVEYAAARRQEVN
jgi:hypothetical protein